MDINLETGVPIVFDTFHHECLNNGETFQQALSSFAKSWNYSSDGYPIIDYSSQCMGERKGKHSKTLDKSHFVGMYNEFKNAIIENQADLDLDIMLEIKDKEKSALLALKMIKTL